MIANVTRSRAVTSRVAPTSRRRAKGSPWGPCRCSVGVTAASAQRRTPGMHPNRSAAARIAAPVEPEVTIASALPSATSEQAT